MLPRMPERASGGVRGIAELVVVLVRVLVRVVRVVVKKAERCVSGCAIVCAVSCDASARLLLRLLGHCLLACALGVVCNCLRGLCVPEAGGYYYCFVRDKSGMHAEKLRSSEKATRADIAATLNFFVSNFDVMPLNCCLCCERLRVASIFTNTNFFTFAHHWYKDLLLYHANILCCSATDYIHKAAVSLFNHTTRLLQFCDRHGSSPSTISDTFDTMSDLEQLTAMGFDSEKSSLALKAGGGRT